MATESHYTLPHSDLIRITTVMLFSPQTHYSKYCTASISVSICISVNIDGSFRLQIGATALKSQSTNTHRQMCVCYHSLLGLSSAWIVNGLDYDKVCVCVFDVCSQ